jgi:hypothetical protein
MLNRLKNSIVMAFSSKKLQINTEKEEPTQAPLSTVVTPTVPTLDLSKAEIEVILLLIKDTSFKGEHVEKIYNLVYKLQQYYMSSNQ